MSRLVSFAALRTARMLKENALPQQIDAFIAQMTGLARQQADAAREAFWKDVAAVVARHALPLARAGQQRRSGSARG